jgi:hypothetical protein
VRPDYSGSTEPLGTGACYQRVKVRTDYSGYRSLLPESKGAYRLLGVPELVT